MNNSIYVFYWSHWGPQRKCTLIVKQPLIGKHWSLAIITYYKIMHYKPILIFDLIDSIDKSWHPQQIVRLQSFVERFLQTDTSKYTSCNFYVKMAVLSFNNETWWYQRLYKMKLNGSVWSRDDSAISHIWHEVCNLQHNLKKKIIKWKKKKKKRMRVIHIGTRWKKLQMQYVLKSP